MLRCHSDFLKLTEEEKCKICNGCGPAGWKGMLVPDDLLGADITDCCAVHDHRYYIGGTREDKKIADREFLENMLDVAEDDSSDTAIEEVRRELALVYYSAVSDHGDKYFNFHG